MAVTVSRTSSFRFPCQDLTRGIHRLESQTEFVAGGMLPSRMGEVR